MMAKQSGFTLLEVTLTLAILAIAMIVSIGVLSMGMSDSRQASERVVVALILEEAQHLLRGQPLKEGIVGESPFYYTVGGKPIAGPGRDEKYFRLSIELKKPHLSQTPANAPGLLAARMSLVWPVNATSGMPVSSYPSRVDQTMLVGPRTGRDWEEIDPDYEPKAEF